MSSRIVKLPTRRHPETNNVLKRGYREWNYMANGQEYTFSVPGWYPDDDSDSIHSGEDIKEIDEFFKNNPDATLVKHKKPPTP